MAKPNEWVKTLPSKRLTDTRQAQFDFWTGFKAYATEHAKRISPIAPQAQNWMTLAIGKTGFGLCAVASACLGGDGAPEIRAEFLVDSKNSKQHYAELSKDREQIQTELGGGLLWYSADGVRQCKIYYRRSSNWQDPRAQEDCYNWLVEKLDRRSTQCFNPESSGSRNEPARRAGAARSDRVRHPDAGFVRLEVPRVAGDQ